MDAENADDSNQGNSNLEYPEKILNSRIIRKQKQYLIKWLDFPEDEATWQLAAEYDEDEDFKTLVDSYKRSRTTRAKRGQTRRSTRSSSEVKNTQSESKATVNTATRTVPTKKTARSHKLNAVNHPEKCETQSHGATTKPSGSSVQLKAMEEKLAKLELEMTALKSQIAGMQRQQEEQRRQSVLQREAWERSHETTIKNIEHHLKDVAHPQTTTSSSGWAAKVAKPHSAEPTQRQSMGSTRPIPHTGYPRTAPKHQRDPSKELVISGIPYSPNENLKAMILSIIRNAGKHPAIQDQDFKCTRALDKRKQQTAHVDADAPPKIIVTLTSNSLKNELKSRPKHSLTVRDANSEMKVPDKVLNRPIYINENLTRIQSALFFQVRQFRRKHDFQYAWTRDGRCYMKKAEGELALEIETTDSLKALEKELQKDRKTEGAPEPARPTEHEKHKSSSSSSSNSSSSKNNSRSSRTSSHTQTAAPGNQPIPQ